MCDTIGGGALLPGLRERLEGGLSQLTPPTSRLKVVSPANATERRFAVWIGAPPLWKSTPPTFCIALLVAGKPCSALERLAPVHDTLARCLRT